MEWKEFTQYIIDAVMQNQVALDGKQDNDMREVGKNKQSAEEEKGDWSEE